MSSVVTSLHNHIRITNDREVENRNIDLQTAMSHISELERKVYDLQQTIVQLERDEWKKWVDRN